MRRRDMLAGLAGTAASGASAARAQAWPAKAITMVVPYAAGGGTDIVGREFAALLSPRIGQQIVIDNRGGAAGNIGTELVARARPDGYTLLFAVSSNLVLNPHVYTASRFSPIADLAPIVQASAYQYVLAVHPDVPARNVAELIALAKAKPDELTFSSSGAGGNNHLAGALLCGMAGIRMTHIPYKGTAPALFDVIAGRVTLNFSSLPPAVAQIAAGKLRALAVTGPKRTASLPDVPTMREAGLPDFVVTGWHGLFAPAQTPAAILDLLEKEGGAAAQSRQMKERLDKDGLEPGGTEPRAEFAKAIRAEHDFWGVQVKKLDIKFEQ